MGMKITAPQDMVVFKESDLENVINLFEDQFAKETRGADNYHLIIQGEYSRELLNLVEQAYLNVGWKQVVATTSSDNGEAPGLTGMQLQM